MVYSKQYDNQGQKMPDIWYRKEKNSFDSDYNQVTRYKWNHTFLKR